MHQQWWMAAVSAPSAVSVIMRRHQERNLRLRKSRQIWRCWGVFECSTVNERCGRKLLPLTGKKKKSICYLFLKDQAGLGQLPEWLSPINTWINARVFLKHKHRSLDWFQQKHLRTVSQADSSVHGLKGNQKCNIPLVPVMPSGFSDLDFLFLNTFNVSRLIFQPK